MDRILSFRGLFLLLCALFCAYLGACCTLLFSGSEAATPALPGVAPLARRQAKPLDERAEKELVRAELGRGAWNLLHRMAAAFDKAPTPARSAEAVAFFGGLASLYPCPECAAHFQELLRESPVDARDNRRLSVWLCRVHNLVNQRLSKPEFACTIEALAERWGSCGCFDLPNATSSGEALPGKGGLRAPE
jgi:hypothetical protein